MIGSAFNTISKEGMRLSEMTVAGYKESGAFDQYGVDEGQFEIIVLDQNGGVAVGNDGIKKDYLFYDIKEGGEWLGGAWYMYDDQDEAIMVEGDMVIFDPGEGLWFSAAVAAYPKGTEKYTLLHSGEALLDASSVDLREGFKGVVAPLSTGAWLSKIDIGGYKESGAFDQYGVDEGQFEIIVLDQNGGVAIDNKTGFKRDYLFYDIKEGGEWLGGAWYMYDDQDEAIMVEDDMVVFEPGEGLWVSSAVSAFPTGKEKYTIIFPGIDELVK